MYISLPAYFNLKHTPVEVCPALRPAHRVPLRGAAVLALGAMRAHARVGIRGQLDA